jgi:hypothetical protein
MSDLTRRLFIQRLLRASAIAGSSGLLTKQAFAQTNFVGKLLVTVQFQGAWDVTSFCDPKTNQPGEKEINTWARTKSVGEVGKLRYAPFGINQKFFDKHYSKMLVVNGVDTQTNAHPTGETVIWSGRTALGFPSLPAIYAATNAPDLALAYLNLGGWGNTEGLINSTRINNPLLLRNIIYPNLENNNSGRKFVADSDLGKIVFMHQKAMQKKMVDTAVMPQDRTNQANYWAAMVNSAGLQTFGSLIPPDAEIQKSRTVTTRQISTLHQQVQMALLAFKSGLCITADLRDGGYDTHEYHDRDHEPVLANALDAVDYLWDYAEQLGLADRLVVVMSSDFSRTPYYNANQGKDHWNITSYVIMEKNKSYTNRMLGETDGGHNAKKINPVTLQRDDSKGALIYSNHVHKALRKYLGIAGNTLDKQFPFNNVEDFKFFG